MDVVAFQQKWIGASHLKEKTAAQSHFNDLCDLLDVPKPLDEDHTGETYTFEKGAEITGGGDGWADVWYNGHFAWEYKGRGKDLDAAYSQLLGYKDDLRNPPLMVVSDLNVIRIHTNFTNTEKKVWEFDINSLTASGTLPTLRRLWTDPDWFNQGRTVTQVTEEAASRFSSIAIRLYQRGEDPAATAHFIMQMVFCLFAEDIKLLPDRLFTQMVNADPLDPDLFKRDARELLEAMNTGGRVNYRTIPHVNGGLFATIAVPRLTVEEIGLLREAAALDWSSIEPAIFGTLFERSLDPEKRSQLGAHYTGREDIERVVDPVVMAPLRRRWDEVREKATTLLEEMHEATQRHQKATTPNERRNATRAINARKAEIDTLVNGFLEEIRSVRVLDPACGSGNFLYVALNHLLSLEKAVMTWRATHVPGYPLGFPEVGPEQVLGIEINEYAQELAQVAIWIGYIQWRIDNGFGWPTPVLRPLENIRLQDALLTFHEDGTVTETEWPETDFIIGNPPFLGNYRMRSELSDDYVLALYKKYGSRIPNGSDLCCYFFENARANIEAGKAKRAGLLATNSIRGGANREVLKRIKETGDIYMAWSDEPWILDGAAVRISIIGFDDGGDKWRLLDGAVVEEIYSDLTGTVDITAADRLRENEGISFEGIKKTGSFDIEEDLARSWLNSPLNTNGRPNSDVVRPYINARDLVQRTKRRWIVDFGINRSLSQAAMYEAPFEYVQATVKPEREGSRERFAREFWWLHQRPRPEMRHAIEGYERFLVTPVVAKHRVFLWLDKNDLPSNLLIVFAREDDYFFGVLHSRAHEVWSLRMGTSLEDRPRYTPTTCFETFPLPWPPGEEPVDDTRVIAIGEAAKRLDELRQNWLNPEGASDAELKKRTLTNLYNQRPTWLQHAHATLDRAVWDAYGWPEDEDPANVEEDVILSRLLALNGERSSSA